MGDGGVEVVGVFEALSGWAGWWRCGRRPGVSVGDARGVLSGGEEGVCVVDEEDVGGGACELGDEGVLAKIQGDDAIAGALSQGEESACAEELAHALGGGAGLRWGGRALVEEVEASGAGVGGEEEGVGLATVVEREVEVVVTVIVDGLELSAAEAGLQGVEDGGDFVVVEAHEKGLSQR